MGVLFICSPRLHYTTWGGVVEYIRGCRRTMSWGEYVVENTYHVLENIGFTDVTQLNALTYLVNNTT